MFYKKKWIKHNLSAAKTKLSQNLQTNDTTAGTLPAPGGQNQDRVASQPNASWTVKQIMAVAENETDEEIKANPSNKYTVLPWF